MMRCVNLWSQKVDPLCDDDDDDDEWRFWLHNEDNKINNIAMLCVFAIFIFMYDLTRTHAHTLSKHSKMSQPWNLEPAEKVSNWFCVPFT
jgi:hypothetical protein